MFRFVRFATAIAAAGLVGAGSTAAAEPQPIRIASVGVAAIVPILFAKPEILKHAETSYHVEFVNFAGSSAALTALATGDIQLAGLAYSSFGAAIQNAHMTDIRIVLDGFQDGVGDYFSTPYLVRNDSGIKSVEDLKGKVLASNGIGGAVDMGIRNQLRRHGMEDKRDYTIIEAQFPSMRAVLAEKRADLIGIVPPFVYDPWLRENAHTLFAEKDSLGATQQLVYVARAGVLAEHRAAFLDFFEDAERGLQYMLAPDHRAEAIEAAARFTKQPPQNFEAWFMTKRDYFRDPRGRPNLDNLQRNIDTQRELGFLKESIAVKQYADFSFIDEAQKRLK
jgi:NitT/TauT family transport system substrate-binding protein